MKLEIGKLYLLDCANGVWRCRGHYADKNGKPSTGTIYAFGRPRDKRPDRLAIGFSADEKNVKQEVTGKDLPLLREWRKSYEAQKQSGHDFSEEVAEIDHVIAELGG